MSALSKVLGRTLILIGGVEVSEEQQTALIQLLNDVTSKADSEMLPLIHQGDDEAIKEKCVTYSLGHLCLQFIINGRMSHDCTQYVDNFGPKTINVPRKVIINGSPVPEKLVLHIVNTIRENVEPIRDPMEFLKGNTAKSHLAHVMMMLYPDPSPVNINDLLQS